MTGANVTRRGVFQAAGAAATAAALARPAAAAGEIDALRARVGERFEIVGAGGRGVATLEEVAALGPHVRPPFEVGHRAPFALVFRQENGGRLEDGSYIFLGQSARDTQLLVVSSFPGGDGAHRLEAVFN